MYFAKESGLEAGSKVIGPNDSETKINHEGDYKEVAKVGFKIATRLLIVTDQTKIQALLTEVDPNPRIGDAVFAKPAKSARGIE